MDETRPRDETRATAPNPERARRLPDPALRRRPAAATRPVVELRLGDVVRLRKAHPCGATEWLIDRLGADIGLRCQGCSRHVMIERRTLEGRIAAFVRRGDEALSEAVRPRARDEERRPAADPPPVSAAPPVPAEPPAPAAQVVTRGEGTPS